MELASAGGSGDATGAADDLKSPHVAGGEAAVPGRYVADLIAAIHDSADKLARGHTSRGDLKILSRTLRELRYAFKVFAPYRRKRKVAVFGSARTKAGDACFKQALEFGRQMAECGWLVVTGAGGGIMEAGHQGAGRENSMGLNILLPFEQAANAVVAGDPKLVHMKYFFTRKLVFVKESNAICLLPGGFGTLDEGLEVLTLLQTGKRDMVPVVFLDQPGGTYWRSFMDFVSRHLLGGGMIEMQDLSLFKVTDQVDEAVAEIRRFFRVYHSTRYVREKTVLRLNASPDDTVIERLSDEFSGILAKGGFSIRGPLSAERDEPELARLPRLVFHFNRRDFGRLRQLIDWLNANVEIGGD
ncbi:MAG: TIGR00730 family Rossman fold protein [Thermoguttaceae bacterium]|jgi:uncharacterized protein (TIGR00730 family)